MNAPDKSEQRNDCEELLSAFKGVLSWKWDSRFEVFLATFDVDKEDRIRAILNQYLNTTWDKSNIRNAPDIVKRININLGKLRPGQLLLTSEPHRDAFIFCAWWPWLDGQNISIRIAQYYNKLLDSKEAEKIERFKGWSGI